MASVPEPDAVVLPADTDPVVAAVTERIGGPSGQHRGRSVGFWTPLRALVALATLGYTVGYLTKLPCHLEAFAGDARYRAMCYSDIPFLYQLRGFADGWLPYIQTGPGRGPALEYPVLTGFFMQIGSWLTGHGGSAQDRALTFYDWNVLLLFGCFLATVVFTALTVRRRPWDAAMVALAPGVILCARHQLGPARRRAHRRRDARVVARPTRLGRRPARARRRGEVLPAAAARSAVPALPARRTPARVLDHHRLGRGGVDGREPAGLPGEPRRAGWSSTRSRPTRGGDWGSPWYVLQVWGYPVPPEMLNKVAVGFLGLFCLGVAALIVSAPKRRRASRRWRSSSSRRSASRTRSTRRSTCCGSSRSRRWPGHAGATS